MCNNEQGQMQTKTITNGLEDNNHNNITTTGDGKGKVIADDS